MSAADCNQSKSYANRDVVKSNSTRNSFNINLREAYSSRKSCTYIKNRSIAENTQIQTLNTK